MSVDNKMKAFQIRDKVLSHLPPNLIPENAEDKWFAAMIAAGSYYLKSFPEEKGVVDSTSVVGDFLQGRCVKYSYYKLNKVFSEEVLRQTLEMYQIHVSDDPLATCENTDCSFHIKDSMPQEIGLEEEEVLRTMWEDGYPAPDIADYAGRPWDVVIDLLYKYHSSSVIGGLVNVAKMWRKGYSVDCISYLYHIEPKHIIKLLTDLHYPILDSYPVDFNINTVNQNSPTVQCLVRHEPLSLEDTKEVMQSWLEASENPSYNEVTVLFGLNV